VFQTREADVHLGESVGNAPDGTSPNLLLGAQTYLVICGIIIIIVGLTCTFLVRERYYSKLVAKTHVKVSIRETLWQTLQCQPSHPALHGAGLQHRPEHGRNPRLCGDAFLRCLGNNSVANFWNS